MLKRVFYQVWRCVMKVDWKSVSKPIHAVLTTRLPAHVEGPCSVVCEAEVVKEADHHVLTVMVCGEVKVICQRCLETFNHDHRHTIRLAVCSDESQVATLMERYDGVMVGDHEPNLIEIVTDDLHLSVPERHLDIEVCDQEMQKMMDHFLN